ncbi:hypothetical protein [Phyllobacterium meliloti]|uniref:hypothetical protein n=1 Tax=Phyllobacterium meliloti TaxID=555317 RepID=UPI001D14229B|nr:hypothetical protein [Phyllobacterium sp. T1293]UGX87134.1 hypothetical protein LLE53_004615 [Phyllobacterium sp. T1293]
MKISGKKDIVAERLRGRAAIDLIYVPRINEAMGPKFALYQAKATLAYNQVVMSDNDSPNEIIERHEAHINLISTIESQRQAAQAQVDAATSAAEIDAIIAAL